MAINRDTRDQYLGVMGVQVYKQKQVVQARRDALVETSLATMDIQTLSAAVEICTKCELANITSQKAFATGDKSAKWLIVSDKPPKKTGASSPFFSVESSQLLESILFSVNESSQTTYTTTAVKCSQHERLPSSSEYACCNPYLARQIALIQPSVIVLLGEAVSQQVLLQQEPIEQLRRKIHTTEMFNVPVVVTYHPDQLLNTPSLKRAVWEDIQLAKSQVLN